MKEEFVVGFVNGGLTHSGYNSKSLTPIDIVMDITGLTYDEVKSCCEVIELSEPEIPEQP